MEGEETEIERERERKTKRQRGIKEKVGKMLVRVGESVKGREGDKHFPCMSLCLY